MITLYELANTLLPEHHLQYVGKGTYHITGAGRFESNRRPVELYLLVEGGKLILTDFEKNREHFLSLPNGEKETLWRKKLYKRENLGAGEDGIKAETSKENIHTDIDRVLTVLELMEDAARLPETLAAVTEDGKVAFHPGYCVGTILRSEPEIIAFGLERGLESYEILDLMCLVHGMTYVNEELAGILSKELGGTSESWVHVQELYDRTKKEC